MVAQKQAHVRDPDHPFWLARRSGVLIALSGAAALIGAAALMWTALMPDKAMRFFARLADFVDPRSQMPDRNLISRIKIALAEVVSNPGSITVRVQEKNVVLKGPILKAEHKAAIAAVHSIEEVRLIADYLEIHATSDGVPGLQGRREWHLPDPRGLH